MSTLRMAVPQRAQNTKKTCSFPLDIYPTGVYNRTENRHKEETAIDEHQTPCCACTHKTKSRDEKEYKDLLNRLSRIEGQIRGIRGMVERDAYCTDILTQVAAANAALNSFTKVLLANHIRTCVAQDIREGRDETIDELVDTLQRLMK